MNIRNIEALPIAIGIEIISNIEKQNPITNGIETIVSIGFKP
jgi:hypothetical protein